MDAGYVPERLFIIRQSFENSLGPTYSMLIRCEYALLPS
jgi:hypothetical protein